jgi:hypothetical protein
MKGFGQEKWPETICKKKKKILPIRYVQYVCEVCVSDRYRNMSSDDKKSQCSL